MQRGAPRAQRERQSGVLASGRSAAFTTKTINVMSQQLVYTHPISPRAASDAAATEERWKEARI